MKPLPRILVIDDDYGKEGKERDNFCLRTGLKDPDSRIDVEYPLAEAFFCPGQVQDKYGGVTNDLNGTLDVISRGWLHPPRWALVLLDLHFHTGDPAERDPQNYFGLKILREMHHRQEFRDIPVIILSSMDRQSIEKQFADHGVFDFLDKNEINKARMNRLLFSHGLLEEETLQGQSILLLKSLREARRRATTGNDNILILGESGSGKELLAEYIHRQSGRKGKFVPLFTQGVPETLIEDRLFGHVKGAFTGAKSDEVGAAESADKGTLFIDEFGNIPPIIQEKLLRLLDKNTREIQRLGSRECKKLDLLVVMATNEMDILNGMNFRRDLLYRAKATAPIILPPLRELKEDIPLLAGFFIKKYEKVHNAEHRTLTNEALDRLMSHDWPGNIRELENVLENAIYNYRGLKILSANHLVIRKGGGTIEKQAPPGPQEETGTTSHILTDRDLVSLLDSLDRFDFTHLKQEELKGKLLAIQDTFARCIARYLNAAFKLTLNYTGEHPKGEISYLRTIKLISGEFDIKATPARRLLNHLLKISPAALQELLEAEPLVKEAIERFGDDRLKEELEQLAQQHREPARE
jgi:DNA-binding NtrC family response regulator